ncbi:DUF421 domain-containing protein [Pontibacter sp. MBLB2868]|uniref:DUF421 domain-containing protein n=1 Tax=Pontibacter sp. MBLB2868 TaxID=3451555 RepID=UPI003F752DCD
MQEFLDTVLGLGDDSLNWWQMSIRAVLVFAAALLIVRVGNQRIFGKNTAFDIILGIIYGSVLSRAITGNAPFFPTIVAALVLVLLHRLFAILAYHTSFFGNVIKGRPKMLVKDGELQEDVMETNSVTRHDLEEAMRIKGGIDDIKDVERACLERSGDISIIVKKDTK